MDPVTEYLLEVLAVAAATAFLAAWLFKHFPCAFVEHDFPDDVTKPTATCRRCGAIAFRRSR